MLFIFRFLCLFTFRKHKQQIVYMLKTDKSSSIWVSNEGLGDLALDGSGRDRSGRDRSGMDWLGGDWSDGLGLVRGWVRRGLVGRQWVRRRWVGKGRARRDGLVGNGSVAKKVAADPPSFDWFNLGKLGSKRKLDAILRDLLLRGTWKIKL